MLREGYGARAKALVAAAEAELGGLARFSEVRGGMFCWMDFLGDVDTTELLGVALEHGVAFVPGTAFAVEADLRRSARLCFATYPEAVLIDAVGRLRDSVTSGTA